MSHYSSVVTSPGPTPAGEVVPRFASLIGRTGVHVHDPVEDVQAVLYTDSKVDPEPSSTDGFVFPVDSAATVTVTRVRTPFLLDILVRDLEGDVVATFDPKDGPVKVPRGDYLLDFTGMAMKLYGRIDSSGFRVVPDGDGVGVVFDPDTVLHLGARSVHSQPSRTLTTTRHPRDLMRAMSLFGNAMKTWSPERAYPTLRGHPPLLKLGSEPAFPDNLTPPETGIGLTVPPEHVWLYPSAPLAYWLGATVEPGSPALHVAGDRYPLGAEAGYDGSSDRRAFESHVKDVLQYTFLLDCVLRTEGINEHDLDARRRLEKAGVPIDYSALYDASLAKRVGAYFELEQAYDDLEKSLGRPDWRLTADVRADPDRATVLPFLARDLAVIRCHNDTDLADMMADEETPEDFFANSRGSVNGGIGRGGTGVTTRSTWSTRTSTEDPTQTLHLPSADTMSQAWVGDGFATEAAKSSTASYLQRLETRVQGSSRISIDVVVNDQKMADERTVSEIYGTRERLQFDIRTHEGLTSEELSDVFERETDFVHYIGHVDPEGFECADGYLDADDIGKVGPDTFVLNACASHVQGQHLVDKGAIAGVVTLEDVISSMATEIGKTIAQLLNYGYPIWAATKLVQDTMLTGSHYVAVGDTNAAVAQPEGVPTVAHVSLREDKDFDVTVETFASWNYDTGSIYQPYIEKCECYFLAPGRLDSWVLTGAELDQFLNLSPFFVVGKGVMKWSDEVTASELRQQLDTSS